MFSARHSGSDQRALADFSKAIEIAPGDARNWSGRGYARQELGDRRGAISDYTRALALDPKLTQAWVNRAAARIGLGKARQS